MKTFLPAGGRGEQRPLARAGQAMVSSRLTMDRRLDDSERVLVGVSAGA